MARDVSLLWDPFEAKVWALLARCEALGHPMRPYFTRRDPWEQARLWRQSRTRARITRAADMLTRAHAPWLAQVLWAVGPQSGAWATNALPGQSWHQHSRAVDCAALVDLDGDGDLDFQWDADAEAYRVYAEEARALGLTAGYDWRSRDAVHVQWDGGKVLDAYDWRELDTIMRWFYEGGAP